MALDYTESGTFKVSMIDYIDEIIAAFDKAESRGRGIKTIAAPEEIYKVDEDREKISPEKANVFHNIVDNTLYTTKCARSYNCTEVAFLTKKVRESNKDEYGKIVHIMN